MNPILQTLIRSILKTLGGYFVAKGWLDNDAAETVAAGMAVLAGVIWGIAHRTPAGSQPVKVNSIASAWLILALMPAFVGMGCARFVSSQAQVKEDGTRVESKTKITTFFDSQASIAKLRTTTTDKTQGLTVGGFSEEASGTNAVSLFKEGISAAVEAAVKFK